MAQAVSATPLGKRGTPNDSPIPAGIKRAKTPVSRPDSQRASSRCCWALTAMRWAQGGMQMAGAGGAGSAAEAKPISVRSSQKDNRGAHQAWLADVSARRQYSVACWVPHRLSCFQSLHLATVLRSALLVSVPPLPSWRPNPSVRALRCGCRPAAAPRQAAGCRRRGAWAGRSR